MRLLLSAMVLIGLAACTDKQETGDPGADSSAPVYEDADGDGYFNDEDCDDATSSVHPGALEVCDGVDNNCDEQVDEGVTSTWYADTDGDGFGDPDNTKQSCSRPEGYLPVPNDCDDSNDTVGPGLPEYCDGLDNNCDDEIDEGVGETFYADTDGDGYGDPLNTVQGCAGEPSTSEDGTDCDDADDQTYPGAPESCDDLDNDCDGFADEAPTTTTRDWYPDADGDSYGDPGGEIYPSCIGPAGYVRDTTDCDDRDGEVNPGHEEVCDNEIDDDCDGVPEDGCPIKHCGTISADETWSAIYAHVVTCDVYVQGTAHPVLTIEDGVTVSFAAGTGLYVAGAFGGSLIISAPTSGVRMISDSASPAAGDWTGLSLGYYDDGSDILGLELAYAGLDVDGALQIAGQAITLRELDVHDNLSAGIALSTGAGASLSDSSITDNGDDGVAIDKSADLLGFSMNTMTGNGGYPISLPAGSVGELDDASDYTGNGDDRVAVLTDTVSVDANWAALPVPLRVTGDVAVAGAAAPTLSLEDGLQIEVDPAVAITIGRSNYGLMLARGSSLGVSFSSSRSTGSAGDWAGLTFGAYDKGSQLDAVTVEHGGGNGYGGIYLYSSDITISDCTVRDNDSAGIYVGASSLPTIEDSLIEENEGYGVYLSSSAGLAIGTSATFSGNTITGNDEAPVYVTPEAAGQIDASCALTGNGDDAVLITKGTVSIDATWQRLDVDYRVLGDIVVEGSGKPVLTIEAGTTVGFDLSAGLTVGVARTGALSAVGTSSKPITLTSAESSPAAGDWAGLSFGDKCTDANVSLKYVTVSYGGDNGYGDLYFAGCDGAATDVTVSNSSTWGIYRDSASPTLTRVTYTDNASGELY